ncbi:FAD-dependent oxidoreductase [Hydrogenophaga pseudoflava]|uniref:FAD-dependent oxidoreductase n=1 Tax=Hydrogenophaga pseudoflava TaxID=47421 RepID=UPI0027E3FF2B|nr:FAD-dependent oxidoreductase [Hydrogenophaga pseudoflava]MDQ7746548.1 FAD-dependent oxidoreductase [Hydrogenophaga pseudoflava]
MKLAVLGAGVTGVTTAFELVQDGHEVTVFERRQTPAEEASFTPGGLLAPEWAAARATLEWEQSGKRPPWWAKLLGKRRPVGSNPGPALLAMACHSLERLSELSEQLMPSLGEQQGLLAVWRDQPGHPIAARLHSLLADYGCKAYLTDAEQARQLEVALNPDTALAGSLVVPEAWSANCRQFVLQLKAHARQSGCRFHFGTEVLGVEQMPDQRGVRVRINQKNARAEQFDGVVVCTGQASPELLKTCGLNLPLDIRVAHALSGSMREPLDAPSATVHDLQQGITIARSGQWVRAVGPALGVSRGPRGEAAFKPLYAALSDWFPGALRTGASGAVQEWTGTVATTPDVLPLLGPTSTPGVWINVGHGMHGWLLACGCARVLADQVSGRPPALDTAPFHAQRSLPLVA